MINEDIKLFEMIIQEKYQFYLFSSLLLKCFIFFFFISDFFLNKIGIITILILIFIYFKFYLITFLILIFSLIFLLPFIRKPENYLFSLNISLKNFNLFFNFKKFRLEFYKSN